MWLRRGIVRIEAVVCRLEPWWGAPHSGEEAEGVGIENPDRVARLDKLQCGGRKSLLSLSPKNSAAAGKCDLDRLRPRPRRDLVSLPAREKRKRNHFERWPQLPGLRNEYCYEELTFLPELLLRFSPSSYDITVTCSYPFTSWALRRPTWPARRPRHVFVTQNGDWPAYIRQSTERQYEYRFFDCDGLVCINPDYYERNKEGGSAD